LLVLHKGNIRLIDERISSQTVLKNFSSVLIEGKKKFVEGDLSGLMKEIQDYNKDIRFPVSV
jgi:hypothetical protein